MREVKTIILKREDLNLEARNLPISKINYVHIKGSDKPIRINEIVLFIDDNGYTKILKNRFGDQGENCFLEKLKETLLK